MPKPALIVIDLQEDFLPPDGSLAVKDGRSIVSGIIDLLDIIKYKWQFVVATQDWHPKDHISFASQHRIDPFLSIHLAHPLKLKNSTGQIKTKSFTVWPDHCVEDTFGATLESSFDKAFQLLNDKVPTIITKKGSLRDREYYSCLGDCWDAHHTDLEAVLKKAAISHVVLVGLAYDFCVLNSAIDFVKRGFVTYVVTSLTRSVYPENTAQIDKAYEEAGVVLVASVDDLPSELFGYAR